MKKTLILTLALCMGLVSCNNNGGEKPNPDSPNSKIVKATIQGAEYLYGKGGTGARSSEQEFMAIDQAGKTKPIRFITENGETVSMTIHQIFDINEKYILMKGDFKTATGDDADKQYTLMLVEKSSGLIHALPSQYDLSKKETFYSYTDKHNNIYMELNGENMIYKINTDNMTLEEYIPKNQQFKTFQINPDGIIHYSEGFDTGQSDKLQTPQKRTFLLKNLIPDLDEWGYGVFIGFDGNFYVFNQNDTKFSIYVIEYNSENNALSALEIVTETQSKVNVGDYWDVDFIPNHVRKTHLISNGYCSALEFNEENKTLQVLSEIVLPNTKYGNCYVTSTNMYIKSQGERTIRSFATLELHGLSLSELDFSNDYELYTVVSSKKSDELSFSGIRFSDSKNVIGIIDENGNISVIEDVSLSSAEVNLIRVN